MGVFPVITKVSALEEFRVFVFDPGLANFRPSEEQFEALQELLAAGAGFLYAAVEQNKIIGYVAFQQPESSSYYQGKKVIELGAVEVAPAYRKQGIAEQLFLAIKEDPELEYFIAIATEYFWHWDVKNTKLNIWEYRKLLEKLFALGGFYPVNTDDPDILAHPANLLMVKYGKKVAPEDIAAFDQLRLKNCWMI
ncbi:GNAT family N-acetyltransferase [Zhaonella formicivorans]|uniref:GNAT family N-acetyltransferase n=1 Tax=Zhaonella formicivorans TaxID=2528593 RepID=UPI001D106AFC|nr:GNAT family N-acetyltransferase [Zhaonella formicivorans]